MENEIKEQNIETEQSDLSWLTEENMKMEQNKFDGEQLPSLKFEENKIVEFKVDFSEPFAEWRDHDLTNNKQVIKKIIPVYHFGEKKNLWLNVKNPLYSEIVSLGCNGQDIFKVIQTGNQAETKYSLVKE